MYSIIRILIGCIIFLFFTYLIGKIKGLHKRWRYILATGMAIISILILPFIPFENLFLTFDTPEAAYRYYTGEQSKAKMVIHGAHSTLVIGSKNNSNVYLIIPKTEDGWKIGIGSKTRNVEQKIIDNVIVNIYQYDHTDDYYMTVFETNGAELELADALESSFESIVHENAATGKNITIYYANISCFNQEYWLQVNQVKIDQWKGDKGTVCVNPNEK